MQLHIWLGGVALASVVAAGAAAPSHAWHRPSAATERKIWRQYPADPNCTYPRKAMRVSDAHPGCARWAAVNLNAMACANGVLLYKSRPGSGRWVMADSFGSDFGDQGSCVNVTRMPARVVLDLTGMTCRGGRSTSKIIAKNRWPAAFSYG